MEDKERFKEYIRSLVRKLQQTMLAQRFEIKVEWDVPLPEGTAARIFLDEPYWYCTIQIGTCMYESEWKNKEWRNLGKYLLHEFCHTVIDPLYNDWIKPYENAANKEVITNAIERQTQLTCFIIMGLISDEEWIPEESNGEQIETQPKEVDCGGEGRASLGAEDNGVLGNDTDDPVSDGNTAMDGLPERVPLGFGAIGYLGGRKIR